MAKSVFLMKLMITSKRQKPFMNRSPISFYPILISVPSGRLLPEVFFKKSVFGEGTFPRYVKDACDAVGVIVDGV